MCTPKCYKWFTIGHLCQNSPPKWSFSFCRTEKGTPRRFLNYFSPHTQRIPTQRGLFFLRSFANWESAWYPPGICGQGSWLAIVNKFHGFCCSEAWKKMRRKSDLWRKECQFFLFNGGERNIFAVFSKKIVQYWGISMINTWIEWLGVNW